ncbi:fasciclin domain-containing protein [Phlyctema vagabunda]|uniref:Fasciclin domain-containing protein n=1 Tax=Phlyctema vagabunda TaxID=108571 RepID=A0ABR4PA27_9HELO
MFYKNLLLTALATTGSAQTLLEALSAQNSSLSSLNALLGTQTELVASLGAASNITILAPNNAALAAFLNSSAGAAAASNPDAVAALLSYHVLQGTYDASVFSETPQFIPTLLNNATYSNVTGGQVVQLELVDEDDTQTATIFSGLLSNSSVVTPNLNFTGGVIHVIDTILTVPQPPSDTALALGLTALVGALTTAGLAETVDGLSDVTIFAPSNTAFQNIGSATGNLTTEQLSEILTYHVINGTIAYSSLLANTTITTLNGQNLTVTIEEGDIFIGSAKVVIPNVLVSNGVVHVIDNVLNPANSTAAPDLEDDDSGEPAFSGASSATDVPFTSGITATTTAPAATSTGAGGAAATSTSSAGAAMHTGAMGAAALFGAAGVFAANM